MNNESSLYDLAIIGGGPGGVAAGVYSARKKIKTILITESFRGQSVVAKEIQNWIGDISISGEELHQRLEKHLKHYGTDIVIKEKESVVNISKNKDFFLIKTTKSEYQAKTILISTGNIRKKIQVKGAEKYEGKGITYCASCDGPMYSDMDVAVIGGGNSAFESAAQLAAYAKSVTIVQRSNFKAEPMMMEKVLADSKVRGITNVEILEIKGDKFVTSLVYKIKGTEEIIELPISGIFVEIGANPSVSFIEKDLVKLNDREEIIVDPQNQRTSTLGIWAAGDCTNGLYRQNNIAVGDSIKAVEDIYRYLKS